MGLLFLCLPLRKNFFKLWVAYISSSSCPFLGIYSIVVSFSLLGSFFLLFLPFTVSHLHLYRFNQFSRFVHLIFYIPYLVLITVSCFLRLIHYSSTLFLLQKMIFICESYCNWIFFYLFFLDNIFVSAIYSLRRLFIRI